MHLGVGLYCQMLRRENVQFAQQAGSTHLVDMIRGLQILRQNGYQGDRTPQMKWSAPWPAGMAYAMRYLRAALQSLERE